MKAFDMLIEDHKKVKGLFSDWKRQRDNPPRQGRILEDIFQNLEVHTKVEEEIVYPACRQALEQTGRPDLLDEALHEHREVDRLMGELKGHAGDGNGWNDKFEQLIAAVEHHIDEEQDVMLPRCEGLLRTADDDLVRRIRERKQALMPAGAHS